MTAVNFPDNPQPGDVFLNFAWDGEKWRNAGGRANAVVFKDLFEFSVAADDSTCLLYTSPSPRDRQKSRMPSSA